MAEHRMMDDNDRFKASRIILELMDQMQPSLDSATAASSAWYETVSSIKNFNQDDSQKSQVGAQLADHSSVVDIKNGMLMVETDHPGRVQLLQMHKRYILEGMRRRVPDLEIKNLSIKLK